MPLDAALLEDLTPKQAKFVTGYLETGNAKQAYIAAGYKVTDRAAEVNASRLLRNAKVRCIIDQATAEAAETLEITEERVLNGLLKIADEEKAPHSARVSAWATISKCLGMQVDRKDSSGEITLTIRRVAD